MTVIRKTIGRLPVNVGDYDSTKAYGKKNRVNLYGCEWESKIDNNTYAPATLVDGEVVPDTQHWRLNSGVPSNYNLDIEVGQLEIDVNNLKSAVGTGGSVDTRIFNAVSAEASARSSADASLENRITPLETAVGTGGSVDSRISSAVNAAKSEIKGTATSSCDTLGEAEAKINANTTAISNEATARANAVSAETSRAQTAEGALQQLYENLTQSDIVVTAGHAQIITPSANTIYREQGTNTYTDWMYYNNAWKKMAEYDNATDDVPTSGSDNLVKSRGVYPIVENISEEIQLQALSYNDGKIYVQSGERSNQYFYYQKFSIIGGKTYKISSYFGSDTDIYFLTWLDSSGNFISYETKYKGNGGSGSPQVRLDKALTVAPQNAVYACLNSSIFNSKPSCMYEVGEMITSDGLDCDIKLLNANISESEALEPLFISDINKYYTKDGELSANTLIYHKYGVTGGKYYKISAEFRAQTNIYFLVWADSLNKFVGYSEYEGSTTERVLLNKALIQAPDNAVYAYLNSQYDHGERPFMYEVTDSFNIEENISEFDSELAIFKEKDVVALSQEIDNSYVQSNGTIRSFNGFKILIYDVQPLTYYSFSGTVPDDIYGMCYLYWYDANDNYIKGDLEILPYSGKTRNQIVKAPYNAATCKINVWGLYMFSYSFEKVLSEKNNPRVVLSRDVLSSCDLGSVISQGEWLLLDSYKYTDVPNNVQTGFFRVTRFGGWTLQEFLTWDDKYYKRQFRIDQIVGSWNLVSGGGNTYNVNNTFNEISQTINLTATPQITSDTNNYLAPSGDNSDRTADILTMLQSNGICRLGAGVYYVDSLVMPNNSSIIGSGRSTIVRLITGSNKFAIKMRSHCTVKDISLEGQNGSTPTSTMGTRHGILWQGNYTQTQDSSQQPSNSFISDVYIFEFDGGGITCTDTGYGTFNCLSVNNVYIEGCCAGVNVAYWSEFNKFTNIRSYRNYYGCINNGGNNVFVNCDFSASVGVAFLMDNSQGQSPNNSHGSCVGCVFNHTASNTGVGIKILNCDSGFIFDGCQIFFSQILIDDSDGVVFAACNFGLNNCDITITGGGAVLFANNMHQGTPPINITSNDKVHFVNCYNRTTGAIISN